MNIASLSPVEETLFLARIAHQLTVSARSTYVPQTELIAEPTVLRAYNELLQRVTASVIERVLGGKGMSLTVVLAMLQEFASPHNRTTDIEWVLKTALNGPLPNSQ
jgi:hypothetical protein